MTGEQFGQLRAFPVPGATGQEGNGMTLLDWFAGMSLAGIQSNPCNNERNYNEDAKLAYETAEAMCNEKAKR